jgi:hypothetical protein
MYKLFNAPLGGQYVIRISDNACIPFADDNSDYQTYLKWVAQGGQVLPADK